MGKFDESGRQPYGWLGAGALALGVGAVLGAGVVHADTSSVGGPADVGSAAGSGDTVSHAA